MKKKQKLLVGVGKHERFITPKKDEMVGLLNSSDLFYEWLPTNLFPHKIKTKMLDRLRREEEEEEKGPLLFFIFSLLLLVVAVDYL